MNSSPGHCTSLWSLHYYIYGYYYVQRTSTVESYRHLICHLSTLRQFAHCLYTACICVCVCVCVCACVCVRACIVKLIFLEGFNL